MILGLEEEELFAKGHNSCSGCGPAISMRHILKAAGKNTIVCQATGCMEVVSTAYPLTAWEVPYIHVAFENVAAVASGVEAALKKLNKKINILAIAGDGGTFDIGFQALSGLMERGHKVCFICYDNAGYMNTGVQRSGATPKYAATTTTPAGTHIHGKFQYKKPMPFIVAAHGSYVATANIAFPLDFNKKIKKALKLDTPSYIQVFTPCVPGWKISSSDTIKSAKLAYQTRINQLYEIENGILKFSMKPSQKMLVEEYLKLQGRFSHLNKDEIKEIQNHVDSEWEKLINLEKSKIKMF